MSISADHTTRLKALRADHDTLCNVRAQVAGEVLQAEAAADRIRLQVSTLDGEIAQLSNARIPVEADRIAAIIAGSSSVAQPSAKDIEDSALRLRQATALRAQAAHDLGALLDHIGDLTAMPGHRDQAVTECNAEFYRRLADAVLESYKRNAQAFIEQNVPALYSVVAHLRTVTGEGPDWQNRVMSPSALAVFWLEDELTQEGPSYPKLHKRVQVWPRNDGHLVSGAPVVSDDVVERIIESVLGTPAAKAAT